MIEDMGAKLKAVKAPEIEVIETESDNQNAVASLVIGLLSGATKSVQMSTTLFPDFYQGRDQVQLAVTEAAKRCKGNFDILLDLEAKPDELRDKVPFIFELAKKNLVKLHHSTLPVPHWLIIDGRDARIEKPHPLYEPTGSNTVVWNMTADLSKEMQEKFRQFVALASPVPSEP